MLEARRFAVKEQRKFLSAVQTYDIYDPDTNDHLGVAEETIGPVKQVLRWFVSKALLGTEVDVREKPDNSLVFRIRRGPYIFRSRVEVLDAQGELVGYFVSKILTIGGGFHVYTKDDTHFAEVKGNWIGFDYRFLSPDRAVELGRVTKEWRGLATEFLFSADSYLVEPGEELAGDPMAKMLLLAAALATDLIFKSESRTGGESLLDNI
jgi:uncharacterized protein YxjI